MRDECLWNGPGHAFKAFQLFRKLESSTPYTLALRPMYCSLVLHSLTLRYSSLAYTCAHHVSRHVSSVEMPVVHVVKSEGAHICCRCLFGSNSAQIAATHLHISLPKQ